MQYPGGTICCTTPFARGPKTSAVLTEASRPRAAQHDAVQRRLMDFTPRPHSVLPLWDQVRSRACGCANPMGAAVRGEDGGGPRVLCASTRRRQRQIRVGGVGLPQRHVLVHDFAGCRPWQVAKFGSGGRGGHCSIRSQSVNGLQENMSEFVVCSSQRGGG